MSTNIIFNVKSAYIFFDKSISFGTNTYTEQWKELSILAY